MRSRPAARAALSGLAAAVALTSIAACRSERAVARPATPARALVEGSCSAVAIPNARCFHLAVPEDRANPTLRTINLRIVVLPATGSRRAPDPIFALAGGPGQAATDLIGDTSLVEGALREERDLVFADQRGTGGSNALTCRFYGPPDDAQSYFQGFLPVDKVRACRTSLERTADLAQYTTAASVDDLESIRVAFGYPQINLIGGSYGTRLAMEYVRRYESHVRSVILEGPVTPANHVPEHFGQLAARALDDVLEECVGTAACSAAFPRIREETRIVFERLRGGTVTAMVSHPSRQQVEKVTLTRDNVAEAIRYMLYSSGGASRVPLYLHEAFSGNYSPIAQFLMRWRGAGTFDGLYLSITCAEDVPLVAADAAERDDPTFLGGYRVREQRAACAEWPRGTVPATLGQPVSAAVPTLIVSGTLDPVTPSANGDELMRTLTHGVHIRVPAGGHSPDGLTGLECLARINRALIERGSTDGLDTSCVSHIARPGFVTRP